MVNQTFGERVLTWLVARLTRKPIARLQKPREHLFRVTTRLWWPFVKVEKAASYTPVGGGPSFAFTPDDLSANSVAASVQRRLDEVNARNVMDKHPNPSGTGPFV